MQHFLYLANINLRKSKIMLLEKFYDWFWKKETQLNISWMLCFQGFLHIWANLTVNQLYQFYNFITIKSTFTFKKIKEWL